MTETDTDSALKLAHMARQIADFFKAYPEEKAVPGIAEHINKFWSKRMREDFLAAFRQDDPRLDALVAKAMPKIKGWQA